MDEERIEQRAIRHLSNAERVRDGSGNQRGVGNDGQLHQPRAVAEPLEEFGTGLDRTARFPRAAGGHERDQPVLSHQLLDLVEILLAPHKGCELRR